MKSKKSIISCLCFISLLSACNNSSSIIDTSSSNDETNKVLLQEMLNKASEGVEQNYEVPIEYALNPKTQDISITPIGWTVQQDLLTVHYYTNSYLKTYFQYGEYYFSINLTRVSE